MNDNDAIQKTADSYLEYFKDEKDKLDKNFEECKALDDIINTQIKAITAVPPGRGTQHYLIDHITNEISLKTQEKELVKDMTNLKKIALDYSIKLNGKDADTGDNAALLAALNKLVGASTKEKDQLNNAPLNMPDDKIVDKEIDDKLKNNSGS